jgi:hypothetical protein
MSRDVEIRPYQRGDEVGIVDLFNAVFGENDRSFVPRRLEHWRWQFEANPLSHHTYVAVDRASAAIVGTYTAIPGNWQLDGASFIGSQAVDTCVHKEHRSVLKREGVFLTLAREWFARYGQPDADRIVYGFPNPIAYRIGTKQLDYRPVHTPVVASVRDFDQAWIDYLPGMGGERLVVESLDDVPGDVDALAAAAAKDLRLVQTRDTAYLRWRYRDCPTHRYRILAAREPAAAEGTPGALRGLLVMRTSWFDKPLAPLVDWVVRGDDQEAFAALAHSAANLAKAAGKSRLETWVPPWSDHARTLATIGFAPDPSRFNLCIRVFGPAIDEHWAKQHWFFTMGDSDIY